MAGAMGGATLAVLTGYILESTGGHYMIIFCIAASAYLLALAIIHLLAPNLEPVEHLGKGSPSVFSLGSLLGFGFTGLVLGSFGGWCFGLIARQSGSGLLKDMIGGAIVGIIIGMVLGSILSRMSRPAVV
jgi:hypothetical protein